MGTIVRSTKSATGTTNFGANTIAKSAEVNSDLNTIYSEFNGSIDNDNVASDAAIVSSKLNLASISQAIAFTATASFASQVQFSGITCASLQLTAAQVVPVTAILDEDNMASNTTAAIPTQQSVKAYVDTSIAAIDLTQAELFTSSGTFTAPTGVNFVFVSMCGGGGGGGGGNSSISSGGGGGGGGAYIIRQGVNVVAGNSYSVVIGAGGAGASDDVDGSDGGATTFTAASITLTCNGGSGGKKGTTKTGGAGGTASGSINGSGVTAGGPNLSLVGGNGGDGISTSDYAGGGGGGSNYGKGGTGAHEYPTVATAAIGYGSGGGGGGGANASSDDGTSGAGGMVYIEW